MHGVNFSSPILIQAKLFGFFVLFCFFFYLLKWCFQASGKWMYSESGMEPKAFLCDLALHLSVGSVTAVPDLALMGMTGCQGLVRCTTQSFFYWGLLYDCEALWWNTLKLRNKTVSETVAPVQPGVLGP